MLRFHLDEHIDTAIAEGLRRRGIDVTTTADARLRGAADEDHIAFALPETRVIVTKVPDFLQLHRAGVPHAGIAFTEHGLRSIGQLLRGLMPLSDCLDPGDMINRVEFV